MMMMTMTMMTMTMMMMMMMMITGIIIIIIIRGQGFHGFGCIIQSTDLLFYTIKLLKLMKY